MEPQSPAFLGPDHWQQIVAASREQSPADNVAATTWEIGARKLVESMTLSGPEREQARSAAEDAFQRALLRDPGQSDGWLGLMLLAGGRVPLDLSRAAAYCSARLGEEQRRYRRPLALTYSLLFSARLAVTAPTDLRLAHAANCMLRGEDGEAAEWAARCDGPSAQAAQASLSLRSGRWEEALPLCQRLALSDDPVLRTDGLIGAGLALLSLGQDDEAEITLHEALALARHPEARMSARYALSRLYRRQGDEVRELAELELIERDEPDFGDVARRLDSLRQGPDRAWLRILEALDGPPAELPEGHPDARG